MIGLTSSQRGGELSTPTLSLQSLETAVCEDDRRQGGDSAGSPGPTGPERAPGRGASSCSFDLGAVFALNRIKFFPRNADPAYAAPDFPNQKDFLKSFRIHGKDGAQASVFEELENVPKNEEQGRRPEV